MKLVVFSYDFPDRRSQDFLLRLFLRQRPIAAVLGAPWRKLSIPPPAHRTRIRHVGLVHPRQVAERIGAPYHALPHAAAETVDLLKSLAPDVGIIAGARILKKPVIDAFRMGIINFHPGMIPEARGLDALLWSIHGDVPLGVTAHLIDEQVDAGRVLIKHPIPIHPDDSALDLSERLYESQLDLLEPAIEAALAGEGIGVDPSTPHNRKMTRDQETLALARLPDYVRRHAAPRES